jgi:hypothetical protein
MLPFSLAKNMPLNEEGCPDRLRILDADLRDMFDGSIKVMVQVGGSAGVGALPGNSCSYRARWGVACSWCVALRVREPQDHVVYLM